MADDIRPIFLQVLCRSVSQLARRRFHVRDLRDPCRTVCNVAGIAAADMVIIGHSVPDADLVCVRCLSGRPDAIEYAKAS